MLHKAIAEAWHLDYDRCQGVLLTKHFGFNSNIESF